MDVEKSLKLAATQYKNPQLAYVEITTNAAGAACPVGELEKVLAVGGGERPGKAAETYRDVRYGLIEFLKKKGLPAHITYSDSYFISRDRYVGTPPR